MDKRCCRTVPWPLYTRFGFPFRKEEVILDTEALLFCAWDPKRRMCVKRKIRKWKNENNISNVKIEYMNAVLLVKGIAHALSVFMWTCFSVEKSLTVLRSKGIFLIVNIKVSTSVTNVAVFSFRPTEGLGSVHNPAKSCDEILTSVPGAQSGVFWLQAARGRPYQVSATVEDFTMKQTAS